MEQLLEACYKFLRKNKIKILNFYCENNTAKHYLQYICSYQIIRIKSVMLPFCQCFIINNIYIFYKIELMLSKVEVFSGLIQAHFQGGDHILFM